MQAHLPTVVISILVHTSTFTHGCHFNFGTYKHIYPWLTSQFWYIQAHLHMVDISILVHTSTSTHGWHFNFGTYKYIYPWLIFQFWYIQAHLPWLTFQFWYIQAHLPMVDISILVHTGTTSHGYHFNFSTYKHIYPWLTFQFWYIQAHLPWLTFQFWYIQAHLPMVDISILVHTGTSTHGWHFNFGTYRQTLSLFLIMTLEDIN